MIAPTAPAPPADAAAGTGEGPTADMTSVPPRTPSLFDVLEPTQGATRRSDPETSVTGARRSRPGAQRYRIACELTRLPYVTADMLADGDPHGSHRSVWSTRLGGLVRDGLVEKAGPVRGRNQLVVSYVLTEAGRVWVRGLLSERRAS